MPASAAGCRGSFPFPAQLGQKARSGRRRFIQQFLAAVAIEANGGCHQQCLRRPTQAGQQVRQRVRRMHPAGRHFPLVGSRPAVPGHAGAGKMDGGGKPFQRAAALQRAGSAAGFHASWSLEAGAPRTSCRAGIWRAARAARKAVPSIPEAPLSTTLDGSSLIGEFIRWNCLAFDELDHGLLSVEEFSTMGIAFDWGNNCPARTRGGGR